MVKPCDNCGGRADFELQQSCRPLTDVARKALEDAFGEGYMQGVIYVCLSCTMRAGTAMQAFGSSRKQPD